MGIKLLVIALTYVKKGCARMQPTWQDVRELTQQLIKTNMDYWLSESLFSFRWWILLITTISVFLVWLVMVDKKRLLEIITYGSFVNSIAVIGDSAGISLGLWNYPVTLTPTIVLIEVHRAQMPFIYMIIYQYFNKWRPFLIATAINAFVFAFIFEPLLVWLHIYEPYHWKHFYSFFPYIFIAVIFKWLIGKLKRLDYQ